MLVRVAVVTNAKTKVRVASPTTLSPLTKSLVSSAGVVQALLPAGSRVVSWVVTRWPAALVALPSQRTTTSSAPSIAVLPAKPQGSEHRAAPCSAHGPDGCDAGSVLWCVSDDRLACVVQRGEANPWTVIVSESVADVDWRGEAAQDCPGVSPDVVLVAPCDDR
jgi:hypothetical protein